MPAQETELIEQEELLRTPAGESTIITIRINKRLLELLDERIRYLRKRGIRVSRNYIINRLILSFVKAPLEIVPEENVSISIERVEVSPRRQYTIRQDVTQHNTLQHITSEPQRPAKRVPEELVRRVLKALKAVKYLSREQKIETLEPLIEELTRYKEDPWALYWLRILENELNR